MNGVCSLFINNWKNIITFHQVIFSLTWENTTTLTTTLKTTKRIDNDDTNDNDDTDDFCNNEDNFEDGNDSNDYVFDFLPYIINIERKILYYNVKYNIV